MRAAIQIGLGTMLAFLLLGVGVTSADDVLTMRSGKTMRGKLLSYTDGALILEDMNRNVITGKMSAVAAIQFDAPPLPIEDKASPNMAGVSIEQLKTFPEKYVGEHFTFSKCAVAKSIQKLKNEKFYSLQVHHGNSIIGSTVVLSNGEIVFVISPALADKLAPHLKGSSDYWLNCTLDGDIVPIVERERITNYVALVTGLDVSEYEGKETLSFRDEVR